MRNLRIWLIPGLVIHLIALVRAIPLWSVRSKVVGRFGQLTIGTHAIIDMMLVTVLVAVFAASYSGQVGLLRGIWNPAPTEGEKSVARVLVRLLVLGLLYWFAWRFGRVILTRATT
jgi:Kef-type K+ transport system membrane component KefB